MRIILLAAFLAVALVGCGGGPSSSDIETAFLADLQKIDPNAKIERFDVGKCEKRNDAPGYACGISVKVSYSMMGVPASNDNAATVVMDKVGGDWKLIGTL